MTTSAPMQRLVSSILAASLGLLGCSFPGEEPATWANIHPAIIQPACATAGCHSELTQTFGVDLADVDESYAFLIAQGHVVPGEPEKSRLMFLLRGVEVSKPMPPDAPLPGGDIELIEAWIRNGAPLE